MASRKLKQKPTRCIVCRRNTIYANAEEHPYPHWIGKCQYCGADQAENAFIDQLYALDRDLIVPMPCPMGVSFSTPCSHIHNVPLGGLLPLHAGATGNGAGGWVLYYGSWQTGCPECGNFICANDLMRHRGLVALKTWWEHLLPDAVAAQGT